MAKIEPIYGWNATVFFPKTAVQKKMVLKVVSAWRLEKYHNSNFVDTQLVFMAYCGNLISAGRTGWS